MQFRAGGASSRPTRSRSTAVEQGGAAERPRGSGVSPKSAVLAITYRCNSRCTMCDIWQKKDLPPDLPAAFYRRLPASLREVNLSGGEPVLRNDLPEIIAAIQERCRGVRIIISTNGLLPQRTVELLEGHPEIGVRVSIDGLEEEHDRIRGIPGSYAKGLETLDRLQRAGFRDLGISYTISAGSAPRLAALKKLADERGMEFTCSVVHSSEFYFGDQAEEVPNREAHIAELIALERQQLRSCRPKEWFRAYYTEGLIRKLRGERRMIPCLALEEFFYLDPYGNVYPCNVLDRPIGNLREHSYDELVRQAPETLAYVRSCPVQCWMVCTAAPAMRRNIVVPGLWICRRMLAGRKPQTRVATLPERAR
ncbi:MAG: radical SAM protein [Candidatus Eisenbacteria bacterium]|nr:radical SAM protein [Candidatus Eisenbacteria bacterium]